MEHIGDIVGIALMIGFIWVVFICICDDHSYHPPDPDEDAYYDELYGYKEEDNKWK